MVDRERLAEAADRARRHSPEILCLLLAGFLVLRVAHPSARGETAVSWEERARAVLAAIHAGQARSYEREGRFAWLGRLCADAGTDSPLAALDAIETRSFGTHRVELARLGPYWLAVFVVDPGQPDDRAWAPADATDDPGVGLEGYGAFAWPRRFGDPCEWAFFVDQRGLVLGTWNPERRLAGTAPPFPPVVHPLHEYLRARKEGEEGVWFRFRRLPEIVTRTAAGASSRD